MTLVSRAHGNLQVKGPTKRVRALLPEHHSLYGRVVGEVGNSSSDGCRLVQLRATAKGKGKKPAGSSSSNSEIPDGRYSRSSSQGVLEEDADGQTGDDDEMVDHEEEPDRDTEGESDQSGEEDYELSTPMKPDHPLFLLSSDQSSQASSSRVSLSTVSSGGSTSTLSSSFHHQPMLSRWLSSMATGIWHCVLVEFDATGLATGTTSRTALLVQYWTPCPTRQPSPPNLFLLMTPPPLINCQPNKWVFVLVFEHSPFSGQITTTVYSFRSQ